MKTNVRIDRVEVRVRGRADGSVPAAEMSRRILGEVRERLGTQARGQGPFPDRGRELPFERGGTSSLEAVLTGRLARALGAARRR